ncbi:MAG: peptidylprolyl isomerase, partial [Prochlorothrix sp.]|nr:peptidylprolyl isomerase [Prochlorothrix sp.]
MTFDLQIGDQHLTAFTVMPLLARYQLLPKLAQEVILDRALAAIDCTPEETQASLEQFCAQNRFQTPDQG